MSPIIPTTDNNVDNAVVTINTQLSRRKNGIIGVISSSQLATNKEAATIEAIPAVFQKVSASGVAQMPVATRMKPVPLVSNPAHPTDRNRPLLPADDGITDRQKGARTRKVSSNRPRVLVYSPSKIIATMTRKAATSAPNIPTRNVRGAKGPSLIEAKLNFPNTRRR